MKLSNGEVRDETNNYPKQNLLGGYKVLPPSPPFFVSHSPSIAFHPLKHVWTFIAVGLLARRVPLARRRAQPLKKQALQFPTPHGVAIEIYLSMPRQPALWDWPSDCFTTKSLGKGIKNPCFWSTSLPATQGHACRANCTQNSLLILD